MAEYLANGAQLGWLIDPIQRKVYVNRPSARPNAPLLIEELDDTATVSGDPVLPGFTLRLADVWEAGA